MSMISFDPDINIGRAKIILVGCGGTGSELAKILCRTLYHMREARLDIPKKIIFVDPDTIEEKNVGRQMFAPQDIGRYKAEVLATRFNAVFGFDIQFKSEPFQQATEYGHYAHTIILGAVDGHVGRQSMSRAEGAILIDSGNHKTAGQVVIGNSNNWEKVSEQFTNDTTEIKHLPNVSLVYPEILEAEEAEAKPKLVGPEPSCAELLAQNAQHLLINQQMALIAGQYLYKLFFRQPIYTSETSVNINTLAMRSKLISASDYTTEVSA